MFCWICFANILWSVLILCLWGKFFFLCDTFLWFAYQDNADHIEWFGKHFLLFPEIAVYTDIIYSLNVERSFITEAIWTWNYLYERDILVMNSISLIDLGQSRFSVFSCVSYGNLLFISFLSWNLSILSNLLKIFHSFTIFNDF